MWTRCERKKNVTKLGLARIFFGWNLRSREGHARMDADSRFYSLDDALIRLRGRRRSCSWFEDRTKLRDERSPLKYHKSSNAELGPARNFRPILKAQVIQRGRFLFAPLRVERVLFSLSGFVTLFYGGYFCFRRFPLRLCTNDTGRMFISVTP